MSDYAEFEEEVLARSKRILFNGNESFVGLSTPDAQLNRHYLYIMFNAIMHNTLTPCDKTLIDKDVILMKAYRARKALLQ